MGKSFFINFNRRDIFGGTNDTGTNQRHFNPGSADYHFRRFDSSQVPDSGGTEIIVVRAP